MGVERIEYLNLLYLILLILPIIVVNRYLGIRNEKKIFVSIIRMVIQLSIVGVYLQYIFDLNNNWVNLTYIAIMMGVASFSIVSSTPLKLEKVFVPIFFSLFIPNIIMVLFFNGVVVRIDSLFDAKYIITIAGMILGNGLSGNIVGLSTYYNGLKNNEEVYNYDLALGATKFEASLPYFKEAVLVSINPTIASMATIGLVSLPGMMTGQILGGSIPMDAIRYGLGDYRKTTESSIYVPNNNL
jgi:putative ABC transport system permease protein